jgi:AcrR family transcriptional regulator
MLRRAVGTRAAIISAAVECATSGGWAATSMQAVRERAGVSNGSLFHHFPTRAALTSAVLAHAMDDHQEALRAELRTGDARRGVRGVVRGHLRWVRESPAVAELLLGSPGALREALPEPALAGNRAFFDEVAAWLTGRGWSGSPSLHVVVALWLGPAHECSRQWLAAPGTWSLTEVGDALADGAWASIRPLLVAAREEER